MCACNCISACFFRWGYICICICICVRLFRCLPVAVGCTASVWSHAYNLQYEFDKLAGVFGLACAVFGFFFLYFFPLCFTMFGCLARWWSLSMKEGIAMPGSRHRPRPRPSQTFGISSAAMLRQHKVASICNCTLYTSICQTIYSSWKLENASH